ncbi:16S rRNA (uracil(1498)-N(3))-methyltransferase [Rickettsiaceae bacterium]|nr:16S rRNA (uracil(1498)-N(3))-methyltransferase [Rickettsiaceae bacterium]
MKFSKLSRVYITDPITKNQTIIIDGDRFHYLKSVMRLKLAAKFRLFNSDDGEFLVEVTAVNRSSLEVRVEEFLRPVAKEQELVLAMCIIKPDRMLEAIRAAVQLGATNIIPVISERAQYKDVSRDRVEKSIIQSTTQSERFAVPKLSEPISLEELAKDASFGQVILASEAESEDNKISNIKSFEGKVVTLVGPEGGFADEEIAMLKGHKHIHPVRLGSSVLRAEIAAIAALSYIAMVRK